jgi:hypothetical protein
VCVYVCVRVYVFVCVRTRFYATCVGMCGCGCGCGCGCVCGAVVHTWKSGPWPILSVSSCLARPWPIPVMNLETIKLIVFLLLSCTAMADPCYES